MSKTVLEQCNYCGEQHEQEQPPLTIGGAPVKVCPNHIKDSITVVGDMARFARRASKLRDGLIPAQTACPFESQCELKNEYCPLTGSLKDVDFSCGLARGFDIGLEIG